MALLRIASLPFYSLAILFGLFSRLIRRIGIDFIELGDRICDHKRYTDARNMLRITKKWKDIND
jgi:hypothetical protein